MSSKTLFTFALWDVMQKNSWFMPDIVLLVFPLLLDFFVLYLPAKTSSFSL